MFCGYPPVRHLNLQTPCCKWMFLPCACNACKGSMKMHHAHKQHKKPVLIPITGSSDCPTELSPFTPVGRMSSQEPTTMISPFTPVAKMSPQEPITMISPFTPVSPLSANSDMLSPITPLDESGRRLVVGDLDSNLFIGSMPGCPACKQLKQRLQEDGFSYQELDTTTVEGKNAFKDYLGFEWMHRTYPQLYVRTERGWYHIGGNQDYQNMREMLQDCQLSGNPDVQCLSRSGAKLKSL